MPFGLTALPGNLSRRELVQRYAERTGLDPGDGVFYYVYGLFKIAVIAQQIYARYKAGLTQDRRFATLIYGVWALGEQAGRAIARRRIDDLLGP
jgi:aminoglycoside phosphotransferase (APT) family kinase protein